MPDHPVRRHSYKEATVYRRTTIMAVATALALLGGGTALAANAGLFGSDRPDGPGTLPAVSTLDTSTVGGEDAASRAPSPTSANPSSARHDDDADHDQPSDDGGQSAEVEDDD